MPSATTTGLKKPNFDIERPFKGHSVNKRPIVILSSVLAMIVAAVFFLFWRQAASVIDTSEQLSKTKDAVSCLDNTLSTLRDAESSERGFVVTADPAYLKPYYSSRALLNRNLLELRGKATSRNEHDQLNALENLMREKVAEMDKTVSVRTPENYRDSWLIMVRGHGREVMDKITAKISAIKSIEEARASQSANHVRDASRMLMTTLPILLIVAGFMLSLLVYFCFKFLNEKKLSELRLSHSYKMFESFMDNSPGFAFIKDREGKYLYTNKSLAGCFAKDDELFTGRRDIDWLPADVAEQVVATDQEVLSSHQPNQSIQVIPNRNNGTEETWLTIKFPLTDLSNSEFVGGVAINITDMKEAEKQIAQLNDDLHARVNDLELMTSELEIARDEAMSASTLKSQFIANMSHEIRTPMSGVLGMSELLLESEELVDDESRELVGYIHSSAKNLLAVVNDLLDFAKLEAGKVVLDNEPFSVDELVKTAMATVSPSAQKKGLSLDYSISEDVPNSVRGDANRLRQVLLNLTHNAVKFTPDGEIKIRINTAAKTDKKLMLAFEISDTGIGITPEAQQKLFEPFVQADGSTTRRYGGTGLGLSICKSLVELMSGRIGVKSAPNDGSLFWFTIPLEIVSANEKARVEAA
ncbi:MAG TPA: ATP-binding protein [Drouetiella sp.]